MTNKISINGIATYNRTITMHPLILILFMRATIVINQRLIALYKEMFHLLNEILLGGKNNFKCWYLIKF
jgi:hypothetical protein